ncbi:integrase core domain-containing protein [Agromyces aerolatus]|uniref:integrase core domain-containing protein n=1 Tax=Agromyces sp. LY-1074 TaxID=3074080 RepID=UPI0037C11EEB
MYTARSGGGRSAFEYLSPILGVRQKNGSPGHPQTQGKIERFHQTQKRWLTVQPAAHTLAELQAQLDRLRTDYNDHRPPPGTERRHPEPGLPGHTQSAPRRQPRRSLPAPLRPCRHQWQDQPPPRRTNAPPRHRHHPHRQTRTRPHRRDDRHRHPPGYRRDPQRAHHPTRPQVLENRTPTTRPMAPEMTDVSRHARHMSRDITAVDLRVSEFTTSLTVLIGGFRGDR